MLEDLREVTGLAVERVVVQQQDRNPPVLGGPEKAGQQQGVAPSQVDVAVAVPDVELQGEPGLERGPRQPAMHWGADDAVRAVCAGSAGSQLPPDEVDGRLGVGQLESGAV